MHNNIIKENAQSLELNGIIIIRCTAALVHTKSSLPLASQSISLRCTARVVLVIEQEPVHSKCNKISIENHLMKFHGFTFKWIPPCPAPVAVGCIYERYDPVAVTMLSRAVGQLRGIECINCRRPGRVKDKCIDTRGCVIKTDSR